MGWALSTTADTLGSSCDRAAPRLLAMDLDAVRHQLLAMTASHSAAITSDA